jgi:signal transduction histidine kinase
MLEISRSEEGIFQKEFFLMEKLLRESLIDVLEAAVPSLGEKLCRVEDQEEFRSLLKEHGIFIEMTGKYCHSPFCHDQKKVQQVLRNLLSNGLKYRRERMTISIRGEREIFVSVEDDGLGIPQGKEESIFDRFVRLKDKRRADVPGYGLGLTGVKALVEAMGGEITLTSREGAGTCFLVRIPPFTS